MMQRFNAENNVGDSYNGSAHDQFDGDNTVPTELPLSSGPSNDQFHNYNNFQQATNDVFDSPQDLNRRTLTQEQFNTMQLQSASAGEFNLNNMDVGDLKAACCGG